MTAGPLDLTRDTHWERLGAVPVQGDAGHPQGLTRWADGWLLSTVHLDPPRAQLLVVAQDGTVSDSADVTDAARFHPGGIHAVPAGPAPGGWECWVPVAEYRPASSTNVIRVVPTRDGSLSWQVAFRFADHLGALCPLPDGTLLAASWGSRVWYRLDADGQVLDQRVNPSHVVDVQDLTLLTDGRVVATGVGGIDTPQGRLQLGTLAVVDPDRLECVFEVPVSAWEPSGRVATYNACHVDESTDPLPATRQEGPVTFHCVVDDRAAQLATWVTRRP